MFAVLLVVMQHRHLAFGVCDIKLAFQTYYRFVVNGR